MISSISLDYSYIFLKCFPLALNKKISGLQGFFEFSNHILAALEEFQIMTDFLNDRPLIVTSFDPLGDSVWLVADMYLTRV